VQPPEAQDTRVIRDRTGPHRRSASRALLALALVLALVVAGLTALTVTTSASGRSASSVLQEQVDRRAAATTAARQFTVNFFTYDYRTLDRDLKRVVDQSTGAFRQDYISKEPQVKKLLSQEKARTSCTIGAAGVSLLAKDQAIVLVTVDELISNIITKTGEQRWRLKLTMQQTPAGWLATDITPIF